MKRLIVFLLMCLMLQTHAQQISIFRTEVAPVIDGSSEEAWNIASQQNISLPFKTEIPTVTATWQAMYDDNNFYVIVTVDDDNHWPGWEAGGDSWLFDKPEVYWDVNEILTDGNGTGSGSGHYQSANGFVDGGYGIEHTLEGGNINPGGTFAYSLVGEGYIYEIAIPWANLKDKDGNSINAETSHPIGFDVTIVDQDEGITTSRQRAVWTNDGNGNNGSTDESWNNMDGCGALLLAEASGISKTKVFLTYQENSSDTVFVNSLESWNATTSDVWISLNPSSGIGKGFFVVSASENLLTKRIGTVTFSCTGKPDKTITITQYPRYELTPGNLASMLGEDLPSTKILTLTGTIDARDFKTMRDNMPLLEEIDLSGVSIVEYIGTEGTSNWGNTNYPANELPQHGFYNKSSIKSITLPESATSISDYGFSGCSNLSFIGLPSSLTVIKQGAFNDCDRLVTIDIPSGVTEIRSSTLSNCDNLETVNIPSTVTTIEGGAFAWCYKLMDISIPSSVSSIGDNAFRGCAGPFTVDPANAYYSSPDGVLFNKDFTILVQYPKALTGNYSIPSSVTTIGYGAFGGISSITSIIIPEGVTAINSEAFNNCPYLTSVVIPSTVNKIGHSAFTYSYSLDSIYNYALTPVDLSSTNSIFYGIDISNCTLLVPYGSSTAYRTANQWGEFTDIVEMDGFFPSTTSVTFSNLASTKKLFIGSSVSWSAESSESWLTISPLSAPGSDSLTIEVPQNTGSTRTATITLHPDGLPDKTIVVTQNGITNVTAGNLASMLGEDLPSTKILTLTGTIDARDFKTMRDNMPLLEEIDLSGVSIEEYNGTEGTSIWGNTLYLANEIPEFAFTNNSWQGKTSLKTIKLPESVTEINVFAFANCINLSSINLPSSLSIIEEGSFQSCEKLTSLVFLEGVTSIGYNAFGFCVNLSNIEIPATVSAIGDYAFRSCTGPITVDAANANFSSLDGVLFNKDFTKLIQCTGSLSGNYTIPSSVKTIGFGAFWNITGISTITIPEGVISINSGAFYNCINLTSVVIPSTVNDIGYSAFAYAYSLDSIYSYKLTPVDLSEVNNVFDGIDKTNCTLFVPAGSATAYRSANQWGDFLNIVEMDGFFPSSTSVTFSIMASTKKLFIGSSVSWSAESSESWLTISPLSAPGSDSLTIEVPQNTGSTRTATITLHPDGLPDKTITITQNGITDVTAGNLASILGEDLSTTMFLTLQGTIDARDFKTMRDNMPLLEAIDLSGVSIVEYNGTEGTSNWGNTNYQANEVPQHGFYNKSSIKSITLPESATSISDFALAGCTNLLSIDLPTSITEIKQAAFSDCDRLVSIDIPSGVTVIRSSSLSNCDNLETVNIPSTITTIEGSAFTWCNKLRDIYIPTSVTSIGENAFRGCAGPFTVDAANAYFASPDGVLFNKYLTTLVQYPNVLTGNYTIPASVKTIEYGAFGGISSITGMTIPEGVTAIRSEAFFSCPYLTSVVIPSTVSYIGHYSFAYCNLLDSIYSLTLTPVDISGFNNVFEGIDKTNCTLFVPYGSATAYRSANQWGDFLNIVEMDGIFPSKTSVAFSNLASTIKLFIGSSVSWSAESSESWLTISPLSAPGSDSLTIEVPQNTGSTRTATITLHPDGLPDKTIIVTQYSTIEVTAGNLASMLGADLSTMKILSLSGTIDARDFKTMRDNMPLLEEIDLSGVSIVEYIGFEGTSNWGNTYYQANEVPQHGFYNKSNLKSITLPESAKFLSDYAFSGCTNLTTIDLPSTLIEIRQSAFAECDRIVSFDIPEGVTTIQPFAFYSCDSLETINFSTTVTHIADNAFTWCYKLKDIFIPSSVTTIDHYTFRGCAGPFAVDAANAYFSSLDGVLFNKDFTVLVKYPGSLTGNYTIPSSVTAIGYFAFGNISSISSITIPEGVTAIFGEAFGNCPNLSSVVIPSSVSYIGSYAFAYSNLVDTIYSYSVTPVDLSAVNPVFDGIDKTNCTLFVPYGTAAAYRSANQWGDFTNIVEMDGFLVGEKEANLSPASGSYTTIPIKANVDWTLSSNQSWLAADPLLGNGDADITLTAISENTGEKRYATITCSSSGLPDQIITVSQNSKLEVSPASVIINAPAGSSATLTVTSSLPWTATADQSWVSVIPSNGIGNGSIVIIADENTGSARNAIVTISTPGLANRIISVKQIPSYTSDVALKHTATPIEVDGTAEALWDETSSQPIDIPYRLETPTVTASWKALFDDQNFYVLVTVEDDNHWPSWEAAGDSWLYDKPEVYWDVNETLDDGLGAVSQNGHYQLSDGFVDGGYDTPHTVSSMGVNPGGTYAYSLVGEGYVYEMAVPLEFLKDKDANAITAQTYYPIGFDVTVVDQDEGITTTRQRCSWKNDGSIDESWNNMDNCGTVSFRNPANTNNRPVAKAGSDQLINAGDLVTLDGSLSSDADLDPLSFKWFAPDGITLNNNTLQNPEFIAPDVNSNTLFPIILIVSDGTTYSITDTVVITVQKGIPESFALSDTSLSTGIVACFNATQTITLAGGGTTVSFESGSIVDLIAGQSIHFLPGFHAQNGSWMDARITNDGSFCDGIIPSPVIQPEMNYSEEKSKEIEKGKPKPEKLIRLYPNPNNGRFTLEIENFDKAVVSILSLSGNKIIQINTSDSNPIPINIPNLPKGIYFLSVYDKQQKIVKKFIVN